jgi:hypothetical protein
MLEGREEKIELGEDYIDSKVLGASSPPRFVSSMPD